MTKLPEDLTTAIRELYHWRKDENATNFHAKLYDLIAKADRLNRRKIAAGFPAEVYAFVLWEDSPNEAKFFEDFR